MTERFEKVQKYEKRKQ